MSLHGQIIWLRYLVSFVKDTDQDLAIVAREVFSFLEEVSGRQKIPRKEFFNLTRDQLICTILDEIYYLQIAAEMLNDMELLGIINKCEADLITHR